MQAQPLCARPDCHIPNHHLENCTARYNDTNRCPGCTPGEAHSGLQLCGHHARRIGTDAIRLFQLHRDLEHVLAGHQSSGITEYVTVSGDDPNLKLNTGAVEVRQKIENLLTRLAATVADRRGFTKPNPDVESLAKFVHHAADWLAAHRQAADISTTIEQLRIRAHSVAYPSGVRMVLLGACPGKHGRPCDGHVWSVVHPKRTLELPSRIVCNSETDPHEWLPTEWMKLGAQMFADAKAETATEKELAA